MYVVELRPELRYPPQTWILKHTEALRAFWLLLREKSPANMQTSCLTELTTVHFFLFLHLFLLPPLLLHLFLFLIFLSLLSLLYFLLFFPCPPWNPDSLHGWSLLQAVTFLPRSAEYWDYRCVPPYPDRPVPFIQKDTTTVAGKSWLRTSWRLESRNCLGDIGSIPGSQWEPFPKGL